MLGKVSIRKTGSMCILFVVAALSLLPLRAEAAVLPPFGGRTLTIIPCDVGLHVTIGPPVPTMAMWTPATLTFLYGPPTPPRYALGLQGPPSACTIAGFPVAFGLLMVMVGTSPI